MDAEDGSEVNAVRREALALLYRDEDSLTDAEIFAQQGSDEFWFMTLCTDAYHRLPSEVEPILLCREYTALQAHATIKRAMEGLSREFQNQKTGFPNA